VLAEGVKTNEQLALLSREARDEVQGYFVRRPLPIEHYTATQLAQAFESLLG
jgi:EAL domain-containing protein (putative c-di-GMP-specific phosphodiesterase class I)